MSFANTSSESDNGNSDDIGDKLIPAITQCFGVIICGYVAGRMRLISEMDSRGMNIFVGHFALPAMIFLSLCELDLTQVNWMFLLAIFISKTLVFIFIVLLTVTLSKKDAATAGLLGIFVTHTNDFAIGYPIVIALYSKSHPEYANYLYLVAPISLVFLNPIGFTLMELGKLRNSTTPTTEISLNDQSEEERLALRRRARLKIITRVGLNVCLHPVVIMTTLGIVANFIFQHNLPIVIADILKVLSSAFSGTALFVLGLRMVGKVHTLRGAALLVPGILIAIKLLMMPLITREVVSLLHPGANETETSDLATFGFLYGTIPTAAGVFVFATQYNLHVDLVASSMVMCTFVSAPLMYISAKMVILNILNPSDFFHELESFSFDISICGILVCVWLLIVFILNGKYKLLPHSITFTFISVQLISSISLLLWSLFDASHNWKFYLQLAFYSASNWASRCLTPVLAWSMVALQTRGAMKFSTLFQLIAIIVPTLLTAIILIFVRNQNLPITKQNPNFQYGTLQVTFSLIMLIFSFFATLSALVIQERNRRRHEKYIGLTDDLNNGVHESVTTSLTDAIVSNGSSSPVVRSNVRDIEDLITSPVRQVNNSGQTNSESTCPERYCCPNAQNGICQGSRPREHDGQILRHQVLLILLLCSMFVSIALNLWKLIMETISGIYVELSFLEAILTFGQPLILFVIFGLDPDIVFFPIVKWWRRYRYGEITIQLKPYNELNFETRHICEQFITHHRDKCIREISSDKRCGLRFYQEAFCGSALVSWLVEIGLAHDRGEALSYGARLLEGGIIQHITRLHHLHDDNTIYTFKIEDLH